MIDTTIPANLDIHDKEGIKNSLKDLIKQTYIVENEYKSLKKFLTQIVESLPNAIWVLDKQNSVFLQNNEAKKIKELIKYIDLRANNSELKFNQSIYLIKKNHVEDKIIISATDITEQRRDERLLSMGKIAAHLSHEIRNPIGSISLLASTLLKKVQPVNKPLVIEVKKSIYRVERIIRSTLLFTKGLQVNKENFFLDDLTDEIEDANAYYSKSKDIKLNIDFPHIKFFADFELLVIVLQNFLYNAIDAIEEGSCNKGVIKFLYNESEDYYQIIVKDNGKEIENENILYEPFKTTKTKGNGLGLALSLQIVKAHSGKIELLKNEKGFIIYLKKVKENA